MPNPSFEAIKDTISRFTETDIEFREKIKQWSTANKASPDLITPDFYEKYITSPPAHSGSNMVGIQSEIDWSEYIGIELKKPLIPNKTYYVAYYIRRAVCLSPSMSKDLEMNKNFGILFTEEAINTSNGNMLIGSPQVTSENTLITNKDWIKISNYFTPKAIYHNLYLGQFRRMGEDVINMKGYYLIDDVSVIEVAGLESLDSNIELPIGSIIPLQNVRFKSGTTQLSNKESFVALDALSSFLTTNQTVRIRINGHTDSKGKDKSNLLLSERRAKFIADIILENGIEKERIEWNGFGEQKPIADNKTSDGRSKNRRVEFEIIE